jgi:transmembrane sensor
MESGNYKIEDFVFNESFQRYVMQKIPADTCYWETWINKNPDALMIIESAKEMLMFISNRRIMPKHNTKQAQVFEKLQNQINAEKGSVVNMTRKIHTRFLKYAASVLLVASCTAALFFYKNRQALSPDVISQYLEVIVPEGQRSQLILPDGTKVWLNSGSLFKYPTEFLKQNRDVFLEGEAFFDVKHNDDIPFVVHLKEKLSIRVLGTEFNVKCYPDEKVIETTLIQGSIKLIKENGAGSEFTEIELKPNEKAIFQKQSQSFDISRLLTAETRDKVVPGIQNITKEQFQNKIEPITAWKEDELVFYDETFEEIAIKMSRWYGLKITLTDENLKNERFTGKFANKETIYQVLDIFNRSESIQYYSRNQEIVITKKK